MNTQTKAPAASALALGGDVIVIGPHAAGVAAVIERRALLEALTELVRLRDCSWAVDDAAWARAIVAARAALAQTKRTP